MSDKGKYQPMILDELLTAEDKIQSLEQQLSASQKQVEALWDNCRIIYYYEDESYPLEHNKRARKIMREEIEHELSQLKE